MALTISLLNMKGGVGKTTLAVNLAWHLSKRGQKKVLLIDLDPQFNASQYMMDYKKYEKHIREKGTIADLLIDSPVLNPTSTRTKKKSLKSRVVEIHSSTRGSKFDFLPSQLALAYVVKNPAQMEYRLEKILAPARKRYDYVFIDCAPTDSVLTTMALTASDYVMSPMRPDRFSILGFGNLIDTIKDFRNHSNDPHNVQELGLVFTQVRDGNPVVNECMAVVRQLADERDFYVFDSELRWSDTFIRAVQDQTPAFETKYARDELKENIREIVAEMNDRIADLKAEQE